MPCAFGNKIPSRISRKTCSWVLPHSSHPVIHDRMNSPHLNGFTCFFEAADRILKTVEHHKVWIEARKLSRPAAASFNILLAVLPTLARSSQSVMARLTAASCLAPGPHPTLCLHPAPYPALPLIPKPKLGTRLMYAPK